MASISVPIEKYKHSQYSKDPFGSSHSSGGFGGHSSYSRLSGLHDNGPPYIVKLLNLPITCDDGFIEDLFKSRYTSFVKFKIVVDPSSNILETHVIKKVAFVELESFQEMSKVLKWQDLYYKATRRVVIELADFHDFQHCISFNQEHQGEILQIEDDFIHKKHNQHFGQGGLDHGSSRGFHVNFPPRRNEPLNSHHSLLQQPSLSDKKPSTLSEGPAATPSRATPPKNKPNPFGLAKPVDVVSKLHEIDKKLITINHTTVRTLGSEADEDSEKHVSSEVYHIPRERRSSQKDSRRSSINILKRPSQTESKESEKAQLTTAPIPESIYAPKDSNKSLAELLSKNGDSSPPKGRSTPKSIKGSPKPSAPKPVILKKKNLVTSANLTAKDNENQQRPDDLNVNEAGAESKENNVEDQISQTKIPLLKTTEQPNVSESHSNGSSSNTEKSHVKDISSTENNPIHKVQPIPIQEAERANDRPNFKKHFADLNKRQLENKDKVQSFRGNVNNKKKNNLNRRNSKSTLKDINSSGDISRPLSGNSKRQDESKRSSFTTPKTNGAITGEINAEGSLLLESNTPGKGKNRHSSKKKSTTIQDKGNEESNPRMTPPNSKGPPVVRNGKKIRGPRKPDALRNQSDGKESKDIKNQKSMNNKVDKSLEETKDTYNAKKTTDINGINDNSSLEPQKQQTDKGEISSSDIANNTNELASSSTGGRSNDADLVNSVTTSEANIEIAKEPITSSVNRSRGRGGRGRGRGSFRGSTRGFRGNRGRGNFNLHYVRNKDNGDTES